MILLNCPSCGGSLEFDENREFMFCNYCGCKLIKESLNINVSGIVELDNSKQIHNFLMRAQQFEKTQELETAYEYYNKILDLDYSNVNAQAGINRINAECSKPNLHITRKACFGMGTARSVKIIVNSQLLGKIKYGGYSGFSLPVGSYKLIFSMDWARSREILFDIKSKFSSISIECKVGLSEITGFIK